MFTLCYSNYSQNKSNCLYPNKITVIDQQTLKTAIAFDHVAASYKDNYRSNQNFISSDCVIMDVDNDHSENKEDWYDLKSISQIFPNVQMALYTSRNHNKVKNDKSARPRFHVIFPLGKTINNPDEYLNVKKSIIEYFPFFDRNAIDLARFLFGNATAELEIIEGANDVIKFLDDNKERVFIQETIPEGTRNSTMYRSACCLLIRYGDNDKTYNDFQSQANYCSPLLDEKELKQIWNNAKKFYENKVLTRKDYVMPQQYSHNQQSSSKKTLKPKDFSDIGQATVLADNYKEKLCYCSNFGYMTYNGSVWQESEPKARKLVQELTSLQLKEANSDIIKARNEMINNAQASVSDDYKKAEKYLKFAIERRNSTRVTSTLKEVEPKLLIEPDQFDANPFLLNTPSFTYDLQHGLDGRQEHKCINYITMQTSVDPSDTGYKIWQNMLKLVFLNDKSVIDFVQQVIGEALIGVVKSERLIIAYGAGANGKSSFFNSIAYALGTYSLNLSPKILTTNYRGNDKNDKAELRGKRLVIMAEMPGGAQLNTEQLKQLASTDMVTGEFKYKRQFSFRPTHSIIAFTNQMPSVQTIDNGLWRRLCIIPFNATIKPQEDIKNYAEYLSSNAGGAILSWAIEGAQKAIQNNYKVSVPEFIKQANSAYREDNDWLADFLNECCEIGDNYEEKSKDLYDVYRDYSRAKYSKSKSTSEFYSALKSTGFEREEKRISGSKVRIIKGLRLKAYQTQNLVDA